jgi:hypothetical protein
VASILTLNVANRTLWLLEDILNTVKKIKNNLNII